MNGTEHEPKPERPRKDPAGIRRRAVEELDLQARLVCRRRAAVELADRLEELAIQALTEDRDRVPTLLDQRVEALKQAESLANQLQIAVARANRLKSELLEGGRLRTGAQWE